MCFWRIFNRNKTLQQKKQHRLERIEKKKPTPPPPPPPQERKKNKTPARKSTNATAKKKPPANLIHGNVPAYDPQNLTLYVSIHQLFRLWLLPYLSARVSLVTVLHLTPQTHNNTSPTPTTYLIRAQNDLYQVNEWVKFVSPFGILSVLVYAGQMLATLLCVLGAAVGWPVSWVEQNVIGGNEERGLLDVVKG